MHRVGTDQKAIDIAIIGAGISGLSLAHFLKQHHEKKHRNKLNVFIFESSNQSGGWIQTRRDGPYLYELGPESLQDKHSALIELIEDLGLSQHMIYADKQAKRRQIYFENRLRSFNGIQSLADNNAIALRDSLRLGAEIFLATSPKNDISLYNFGVKHFGKRNTITLLDAMQSGIYAGNIKTLSAESAFPSLFKRAQNSRSILLSLLREKKASPTHIFSFHEGLSKITQGLTEVFSPITQRKVLAVRQDSDYAELIFQDHFIQAKQVILTTPASVSAKLLESAVPSATSILDSIPYSDLVVATIALNRNQLTKDQQLQLRGFGFLAPRNAGLRMLGVLYSSNSFDRRCPDDQVLLRVFLGGQCDPEMMQLDDKRIEEICRIELGTVLKATFDFCYCRLDRQRGAIPHFEVGHAARMREFDRKLRERCPSIHLAGSSYVNGVGATVEQAKALAQHILRKHNFSQRDQRYKEGQ